ncbi:MAG: GNAT family N-acetyltransferase [Gemmatimonadota bacterium]
MDVTHDERHTRFVIEHEGTLSMLQYRMADPHTIHFVRTWVAPDFRGGGFGAWLVEAGLDYARDQGFKVTSSCWFVDEFIDRTPEYQDLQA